MVPNFKDLINKKLLITGGEGFIGSNLCEALLLVESYVTCLGKFVTGKIENICALFSNERFNILEGNIRDVDTWQKAYANQNYVLHQAALGSVCWWIVCSFFKSTYDFDTIGLRYFNVFGRRQDPNESYAAGIPKFVVITHESI